MNKYLKLKQGYACILLLLLAYGARAQFSSGSGFYVAPGTAVFIDSLTFQPAVAPMSLANVQITHGYTPVPPVGPGLGSIKRVYEITPSLAFRGNTGLYYTDAELNGNTAALLSFAYSDGVSGFNAAGAATIDNSNHYVLATTGINTLTIKKITSVNNGTPLPVHLIDFKVKAAGQKSLISWVTANEFNCDHFDVERSDDATHFSFLLSREARGSIAGEHSYQDYDNSPKAGWNYYRLKQVDRDGGFTYSRTESVFFGPGAGAGISVYPNPFASRLHIDLNAQDDGKEQCNLLDIAGRVIATRELLLVKGANAFDLDFSGIAAGTYWLKIGALFNTQLVKQ
ncbi:T9SS type A sorting domain-containing protein [Taibaiella chishuiensis]|uniref:Putative secreted protein (Por secretion system target) n=1 Tax=Taibaiella chishuiensis TaxID=1434707 RepID=A0A2P8CYN7_9BACT|nr:T9SS type A sorting domain-containing protein [Taibaiella chishuiensis]PSK90082.1 putative secreted protein (Por secretion system target) [Taibaiella chishuiensis]